MSRKALWAIVKNKKFSQSAKAILRATLGNSNQGHSRSNSRNCSDDRVIRKPKQFSERLPKWGGPGFATAKHLVWKHQVS